MSPFKWKKSPNNLWKYLRCFKVFFFFFPIFFPVVWNWICFVSGECYSCWIKTPPAFLTKWLRSNAEQNWINFLVPFSGGIQLSLCPLQPEHCPEWHLPKLIPAALGGEKRKAFYKTWGAFSCQIVTAGILKSIVTPTKIGKITRNTAVL